MTFLHLLCLRSLDDVFKIKDYKKKDIDAMRTEWAETVQEFMYA
ncbi:hypothetical protein ASNO1_78210 [Corallococcus caeni]|uniref:Uncharacterized protein n=1 Tax=Corallococcus caeni TaxID=3082388 RepID=A0ABQ6R5M3_9BACT|nr:hypothetical protein ASNO1_78210 [Corallococcus sp. NO1]